MDTPLYTALMKHAHRNTYSFHVPGHHNGDVFFDEAKSVYQSLLSIDMTEITGLDDLHHPTGVIKEAQDLVSRLYGSQESFFLVNGTTAGNLAMVLAVCEPDEPILIQRNCHKSVFHAVAMAGAKPVYLAPEIDKNMHVPAHVSLSVIEKALASYPNAKGLVLTNPTYYGHAADLTAAVKKAHSYGVPVLVDEAHGAHFVLGEPFPPSSLAMGADAVVQSAHKTLPAMTMGSYFHLNSSRIDRDRLTYYLSSLQSSSPSYPIMASLDTARAYIQDIAEKGTLPVHIAHIEQIKRNFASISSIEVIEPSGYGIKADPLKFILRSKLGHSGYSLQNILESEGIFAELADEYQVLLVLPIGGRRMIKQETVKNIQQKLENTPPDRLPEAVDWTFPSITTLEYPQNEMRKFAKELTDMNKAAGRLHAGNIIPYPPGIPLIMDGERITEEIVQKLSHLIGMDAHIQGLLNGEQLLVYTEEEKS
ncbi:aminotransferase class I/II-fold pyridoxal phosphate-dependent enzyme [Bacillus sp. L381]|uniref:aminotransferase class I/II-fold pyridoxal phosphate-dependent enzyme n=1 Tax=Bacillus TaxID=1386 RepID=UPI001BA557E3|nr:MULTISPECIES: aminotransferase class I/II-fold pyridoxal phosphate-dependent enzyme [Bacillus]MCR9041112.1 aminotransferase class I/II-fold pyridoxal phosphate-dependent enzyme [Bacillus velezensis]QUN09681.1 aminotransferase class I/II-fold pyridoxal phosphate-dependent enzyme [Bacillus amyloliquefaciens]QYM82755.1 aminotransferase class I/II-fold pyridoxal phosphate-dependent enzyme [Bacillus sp. 7D3]QZY11991.1 aminotransferase class I/II-fold pyridoxal phosphate-dependent enzyme [Bacillus